MSLMPETAPVKPRGVRHEDTSARRLVICVSPASIGECRAEGRNHHAQQEGID